MCFAASTTSLVNTAGRGPGIWNSIQIQFRSLRTYELWIMRSKEYCIPPCSIETDYARITIGDFAPNKGISFGRMVFIPPVEFQTCRISARLLTQFILIRPFTEGVMFLLKPSAIIHTYSYRLFSVAATCALLGRLSAGVQNQAAEFIYHLSWLKMIPSWPSHGSYCLQYLCNMKISLCWN